MSIAAELRFIANLDKGVCMTTITPSLMAGDKEAHLFEIYCYRQNGRELVDLSGVGVSAYFIRQDGKTVPLTGETEGNKAIVLLSAACYEVLGRFSLVVKLSLNGGTADSISTVFWGEGAVSRSRTDVVIDPDSVIPSLEELLAQIAAMEIATNNANAAADNANQAIAGLEGFKAEVQQEVSQLTEDIIEIYDYGETEQLGYLKADDSIVPDAKTHSITTKMLHSAPGLTYKYKGHASDSAVSVIFYDENKGILSTEKYSSESNYTDIVTPDNTAFVKFSSFAMTTRSVVFSLIIPEGYGGIVCEMQKDVAHLKDNVSVLERTAADTVKKEYGNLWDGEYITGGYLTPDGSVQEGATYAYTAPVHLQSGAYLFNAYKAAYGSNAGIAYQTDKDGNHLASHRQTSYDANLGVSLITLSEGYYRFNCGNKPVQHATFMVIAGNSFEDWPATNRPYGTTYVEKSVHLNETMKEEVGALLPTNALLGKTIAFEGDSICAGAGYSGGYGKIIAERNGMTYYNTAVGGGVMPSGIISSSGSERHGIAAGVATMNPDADYLIFEGGVNDASLNLTLGEVADGYPEAGDADTLDTSTFLGAFEFACRELVTNFAGKKVGYIFVHGIFASDHRWNVTWRGKMKEILVKWGVPYIDLQEQVPPLNLIPTLKATYTANGDGWHPNEDGYKKYYCDKIEAWMRTL